MFDLSPHLSKRSLLLSTSDSVVIGYTDVTQTEIKQIGECEDSRSYEERVNTGKGKLVRLGFSLRLSNFYIGALQVKHTISEYKVMWKSFRKMSPTDKKCSSPDYVHTLTLDDWVQTENYTAIGYRYFKKMVSVLRYIKWKKQPLLYTENKSYRIC